MKKIEIKTSNAQAILALSTIFALEIFKVLFGDIEQAIKGYPLFLFSNPSNKTFKT